MTNYARGRRKEWDVVRRLRAEGWHAQRSAGSHGLWDVVAVKTGQPVKLVQVKYTKFHGHVPVDDNTEALWGLSLRPYGPVDIELWVYVFGRSAPTKYAPVVALGSGAKPSAWERFE